MPEKKLYKEILDAIDFKEIGLKVWIAVKPKLEAKVADSSSKIDDLVLDAVDVLVSKFLKD